MCYNFKCVCESAGIGRQARLRGVCRMACEFKSHLSHQNKDIQSDVLVFYFSITLMTGTANLSYELPLRQKSVASIMISLPGYFYPRALTFALKTAQIFFSSPCRLLTQRQNEPPAYEPALSVLQNRAETGASFLQDVITNLPEIPQIPVK